MNDKNATLVIEHHAIEHLIDRLSRRYDAPDIKDLVEGLEQQFAGVTAHQFVPVLVEREAIRILEERSAI